MKTYGDAGDRYPIEPGELWRVGDHWLACGDLQQNDHTRFLAQLPSVRMSYTDPPYGAAIATAFRSRAGVPAKVDFTNLLECLVDAVWQTGDIGYMEIGLGKREALRWAIELRDLVILGDWDITYGGSNPAALIAFGPEQQAPIPDLFSGIDDMHTPGLAMDQHAKPGDLVVDFCIGQGLSAIHAHSLGLRIAGLELHPRRLAVTMDKLVKLTGQEPVRVGML